MITTDKILGMLGYSEIQLGDGPQLVATLAYCSEIPTHQVTAALHKLEHWGFVQQVRRSGRSVLWGLTPAGRRAAKGAMTKLASGKST